MMTHTGFPLYNSTVCVLFLIRIYDDDRAWDMSLTDKKQQSSRKIGCFQVFFPSAFG